MRSSPSLPPLHALRAFEAVGRLGSFRRAGEELLITQSAVSHHIKKLEEELGARLFLRKSKSIELTNEGAAFLAQVRKGFDLIGEGASTIRRRGREAPLRVSLLPSFAANWLAPRLGDFRAKHPDIELALDPSLALANLDRGDADLAIRYGAGDWADAQADLLFAEQLTPVVSPALMAAGPPIRSPEDILRHPLLTILRPTDWSVWAAHVGLDLAGARMIQLTDYNIAVQAAADGQGVAMGRLHLLKARLRDGALVSPCAEVVSSPKVGHWLLSPRNRPPTPAATAFCGWLRASVAAAIAEPVPANMWTRF